MYLKVTKCGIEYFAMPPYRCFCQKLKIETAQLYMG